MESEEQAEALSIGWVVGGRTTGNRAWTEEILRLAKDVIEVRAGIRSPLNLNVVFHVAGNLLQPDFEGVRTGAFSKRRRLLMVQAALADSSPPQPRVELLSLLRSAVAEAEAWSKRERVPFDRQPFERILKSLTSA